MRSTVSDAALGPLPVRSGRSHATLEQPSEQPSEQSSEQPSEQPSDQPESHPIPPIAHSEQLPGNTSGLTDIE